MEDQVSLRDTIEAIEAPLRICNPYVRDLLMAREIPEQTLGPDHQLIFHSFPLPIGEHARRYNPPGASELCIPNTDCLSFCCK